MPVKIVRGSTGQADVKFTPFCADTASAWGYPSPGTWQVWLDTDNSDPKGSSDEPNDWFADSSGLVTVPQDAMPGVYRSWIMTELGSCFDEDNWPGHDALVMHYSFEFEVVCMNITITGLY
jgi:hypothetical protein